MNIGRIRGDYRATNPCLLPVTPSRSEVGEVGKQDFYVDLLFYHLKLRCYVVIEIKATEFEPGYVSQLTMYQNVIDDLLHHLDDQPTIGLLLVKGKNKVVVEYSLAGYKNPIGVAD